MNVPPASHRSLVKMKKHAKSKFSRSDTSSFLALARVSARVHLGLLGWRLLVVVVLVVTLRSSSSLLARASRAPDGHRRATRLLRRRTERLLKAVLREQMVTMLLLLMKQVAMVLMQAKATRPPTDMASKTTMAMVLLVICQVSPPDLCHARHKRLTVRMGILILPKTDTQTR